MNPVRITQEIFADLHELIPLAPLHQPLKPTTLLSRLAKWGLKKPEAGAS
jgi:acetate kinase